MARWSFRLVTLGIATCTLAGCAHTPETVVHLSAPASANGQGAAWAVRNHEGVRLCVLPCKVELDPNEAVVVSRDGGAQAFVVHQETLGAGSWSGTVRVRHEPTAGALVLRELSSTLARAGASLVDARTDDRVTAGVVLAGLGAVGMIASVAWPGTAREELFLERVATP
jgi:hypothetical protein